MQDSILLFDQTIEPRWCDFDMYNHLTSSKYIDLSIEARYTYFKNQIHKMPGMQLVTKSVQVDYKKPIYFSESINLKLYLLELSAVSFVLQTQFLVNNSINAIVITKLVTIMDNKIIKIPELFMNKLTGIK
ncbi:acyl-CoA thioesterase [Pigmentibacter sp. JX0631]|uniref:acyl-CoA thioesterase n=1 Tax=Pigmentibacter sp. JX0631 TaxID=2976982 RepID=UPI0024687810|nr:acyl-CoA thioesterase [Pigmentibacter sp. JX0631]WGL59235.1 acyl-CoA thioesterase [Pigmentibacter sp. JX0631]